MSGIVYSELANWDGGLSASGSQAGNASREPTAAPPSLEDRFLAPPEPSGSASAHAPASGLTAGSFAMEQMRDTPAMYGGAPRAGTADGYLDASKKVLQPQPPPRQSPLFTPEPEHVIERDRIKPPTTSREAQPTMPSTYHPHPAPQVSSYTFNLAVDISFAPNPSMPGAAQPPRSVSTTRSYVEPEVGDPNRSAGEEGDESLLDADGDTDNDSTVSVYVISTPSQHAGSAQRKPAASHPRDSTGTTAVSRTSASGTPPPSWEHITKVAMGSYSDEFLEAAQQYYVSPSPSLQTQESAPERSASSNEPFALEMVVQKSVMPTPIHATKRVDPAFSSSLSPLSSLDSSPIFMRTVPHKLVVQMYKPARDVPALRARPLGAMLNQAISNNADLMNASVSPSVPASGRRLRERKSMSASPTKAVSKARANSSVAVVKKRGRPPGSKNKKVPEQAAQPVAKERPSVPEKPIDREQEESSEASDEDSSQVYARQPADGELEPYFPSSRVEIGDLPITSAALFLVAYRSLLKNHSKSRTGTTAGAVVPSDAVQKAKTKTVPPLPRRTQFKKILPAPTAHTPPSVSTFTSAASINPSTAPLPNQDQSSLVQPSFYTSSQPPLDPVHPHAPASSHISNANDPPPPPIISRTASDQSDQLSGFNLLADFGSSSSSDGSPKLNQTPNGASHATPSQAGRSDYVPHEHLMHFQHASQYAAQGSSGGVGDLFAAENALRDVHADYIGGANEAGEMASGDMGQSYFAHMGIDLHYAHSAPPFIAWPLESQPTPALEHGPTNGTIDPSLLGTMRPAPEPSFVPTSPLEDRVAGPSRPRRSPPTGSPASDSQTQAPTAITSSDESHSDDEPLSAQRRRSRAREQSQHVQLPIRLPREMEEDSPSKRPRRLTERARATYYVSDETDGEPRSAKNAKAAGKGKGKGKGQGKGKGKEKAAEHGSGVESYRALAEEPTHCHQCRHRSLVEKMRCTVIKENGVPCGLRYYPAQQPEAPQPPPRKVYVGNRAALGKEAYLPLDALIARWEAEEELEDRAHEWAAPSSDPISSSRGDEQQAGDGQPPRDEVQWAIALALQAVHVDAAKT
ncbi:hypothetical protein FKP32DRAFT_1593689 [Trametes sanguinea]|nr:hypothetical protein FKP32DRAFT_1593689 [Trametes sanguinea]